MLLRETYFTCWFPRVGRIIFDTLLFPYSSLGFLLPGLCQYNGSRGRPPSADQAENLQSDPETIEFNSQKVSH